MTTQRTIFSFIFIHLLLCSTALSLQAAQVEFSWRHNNDPNLSGYKIYFGTGSRNYRNEVDVGLPQIRNGMVKTKILGLQGGQTYYFAATAYKDEVESGYSNEVKYSVPWIPGDNPKDPGTEPSDNLSLQVGEIAVSSTFKRVKFSSRFKEPVIIANAVTRNGSDPNVIRIKGVDSLGFYVQVQEYDYLDGRHTQEMLNYIVLEKGSYTLNDGSQVEAGFFETNATKPVFHRLQNKFARVPVILTSVSTKKDSEAVMGRVSNVSTTGFKYKLQEQEANALSHGTETVAYLAWTPGSGVSNSIRYEAGNTTKSIDHNTYVVDFDQQFRKLPFQFAGMQTSRGTDTSLVKIVKSGKASMKIMVEEEMSRDSETSHAKEVAGILTLLPE